MNLALEEKGKEFIAALSTGPIQLYIRQNENFDVKGLVLKNKEILGVPAAHLSEQIAARKKAKDKLPLYYHTPGIVFPPLANLEQSSSEKTALYKSELAGKFFPGKNIRIADLTGGFGVDSYFLSKNKGTVHYVEPERFLLQLARHNHRLLGASNIKYYSLSAEQFLEETDQSFDLIFIDPSRRNSAGKRMLSLHTSDPDVLKLKSEIFQKTHLLLIKASPLLDIRAGIAQLAMVKKVYVISVNNECKELLFLCEKTFLGIPTVEAINLTEPVETFTFSFQEERRQEVSFSDPLAYLYEPNASILKAGAFKSVANRFHIKKIQPNTHLYTSEHFVHDFPGRKFLIEEIAKPAAGEMKKYFPDGKANVATRNYPLTAEALKRKVRLKDGGEKFLIGFSGQHKKFVVVGKRL